MRNFRSLYAFTMMVTLAFTSNVSARVIITHTDQITIKDGKVTTPTLEQSFEVATIHCRDENHRALHVELRTDGNTLALRVYRLNVYREEVTLHTQTLSDVHAHTWTTRSGITLTRRKSGENTIILVSEARKAMPQGGLNLVQGASLLRLTSRSTAGKVTVSVEENESTLSAKEKNRAPKVTLSNQR